MKIELNKDGGEGGNLKTWQRENIVTYNDCDGTVKEIMRHWVYDEWVATRERGKLKTYSEGKQEDNGIIKEYSWWKAKESW